MNFYKSQLSEVEKDIAKYHTDEMVESRQALVHENARSIFKRKYENRKIKEMEQMRVMALGRSGEELDKIYSQSIQETKLALQKKSS